jgi:hypothetical protein
MTLAQIRSGLIVADVSFGRELRDAIELTGTRAKILVEQCQGRAAA